LEYGEICPGKPLISEKEYKAGINYPVKGERIFSKAPNPIKAKSTNK